MACLKGGLGPRGYRQGLEQARNLLMGQTIIICPQNRRREIQKGILLSTDNLSFLKGRIGIGLRLRVLENTEKPKGMRPGDNLPIKGTGFQRSRRMPVLERGPIPRNQPQEIKRGNPILNTQQNARRLVNKEVAPANLVLLGPRIECWPDPIRRYNSVTGLYQASCGRGSEDAPIPDDKGFKSSCHMCGDLGGPLVQEMAWNNNDIDRGCIRT
jgi:hypothetical protein